jgi:hypothetical protein
MRKKIHRQYRHQVQTEHCPYKNISGNIKNHKGTKLFVVNFIFIYSKHFVKEINCHRTLKNDDDYHYLDGPFLSMDICSK